MMHTNIIQSNIYNKLTFEGYRQSYLYYSIVHDILNGYSKECSAFLVFFTPPRFISLYNGNDNLHNCMKCIHQPCVLCDKHHDKLL